MQKQVKLSYRQMQNESYLLSSVEEGISMIKDGSPKAVLGGRETLYFNMKRHGNGIFIIHIYVPVVRSIYIYIFAMKLRL